MTVIEAQEVKYPIGGADPDNRLRVYRALRSELPDIEGMVHHQVVPYGFESRQSDQGEYQTVLRVGRDPANKKTRYSDFYYVILRTNDLLCRLKPTVSISRLNNDA